jgi:hypothetical protein
MASLGHPADDLTGTHPAAVDILGGDRLESEASDRRADRDDRTTGDRADEHHPAGQGRDHGLPRAGCEVGTPVSR